MRPGQSVALAEDRTIRRYLSADSASSPLENTFEPTRAWRDGRLCVAQPPSAVHLPHPPFGPEPFGPELMAEGLTAEGGGGWAIFSTGCQGGLPRLRGPAV